MTRNKKYDVYKVNVVKEDTGYIRGLVLNRELSETEALHILKRIFGISIDREEYDSQYDWNKAKEDFAKTVNSWLKGELDDTSIMEYAYDCSDEPLGIFNCIALLDYLHKKGII